MPSFDPRLPTLRLFFRRAAAVLIALAASTAVAAADDGGRLTRVDHYVKVKSIAPATPGQDALIYVREVVQTGPALRGGASLGVVLFVHGAGTPASVGFDVPYGDYSWMAYLARAGYDVFAMDLEGYGRSTRPPAMSDPCNVDPAAQKQLVPSVLKAPCPPSFRGFITTVASDWNDIGGVVDHLRALRKVDKVNLVAWSQGGPRAGGFAAQNPDKIARLVILAPNYMRERTNEPAKSPNTGELGVQSLADFKANWDRQAPCPGQYEKPVFDAVWAEMLASDPVGATWGTGVRRAPQVPLWGFGQAMVSKMTTPFLMITGENDKQIAPERVRDLYADLGSKDKVLIDLACSSHSAMWEKNHLMMFRASLEWLRDGTVDGMKTGILRYGY